MDAEVVNEPTKDRSTVPARIGLALIALLWIVYAALLGFMISASRTGPEPGIDPRFTRALAEGGARAVNLILTAGPALAIVTLAPAVMLWRSLRHP